MKNKIKNYTADKKFMYWTFFIVLNATLIYITYFIIRDFSHIWKRADDIITTLINALLPLWLGLILAYIINPIVDFIHLRLLNIFSKESSDSSITNKAEKPSKLQKRTRSAAILITYLLIIAGIIALIYILAALIVGEFIFKSIPDMFEELKVLAEGYQNKFENFVRSIPSASVSDKLQNFGDAVVKWLAKNFQPSNILDGITGLGDSIINFIIGLIVSIYLLLDKDFFISLWNRILAVIFKEKFAKSLNANLHEVNGILSKFMRGVLLDSLIIAVVSSTLLTLLGLKFGLIIGIFAGVANVIPYFGPIMGMIPAFFVGIFTADLSMGIEAVIALIVVQQIDGYIIYPNVVGSSTGLKPLAVLLAVTIFGYYGGILAMILAVPITSIAQHFVVKWFKNRETKLGLNNTTK